MDIKPIRKFDGQVFFSISSDFTCKERLHLVVLLDSSKYITSSEWEGIKQFSINYVKRFDSESVDIDIVSVGHRVEIIASIEDAAHMNGDRYLSDGFLMAQRLLKASQSRKVVLSVTTQQHQSIIDNKLQNVLQNLKSDGVDMMSVLLESSGKPNKLSDEYRVFTSKPFGKNLFKVARSSFDKFTTAIAQASCRSE